MASSRNVWLPGAAVWACLPDSSPENSSLKASNDRKRRKEDSPQTLASELGQRASESGFRVSDQGASSSSSAQDDVMCPICLSAIEEADGAVLQWCMHRFCAHCIEKWSRVRRLCPLCKVEYHGWYYGVQSNCKFQERILPPLAPAENHAVSTSHPLRDSRRQFGGRGRVPPRHQRVAPNTAASSSQRSVPFPTQRSFGLPRQPQGPQTMRVLEEQAAVRALQWRQSIYSRNLLARPFDIKKSSSGTKDANARAERRLEPWVRRELQAVLPNSDHDFLVRLVLGLWFKAEHERPGRSIEPPVMSTAAGDGVSENAINELKRFLGDKSELFWHELRCFAESPFTMQAYDTTVVYNRHDNLRRPLNRAERRSTDQDRSRRGVESSVPLHAEGPGHLEDKHQTLRAGRRSIAAEGVQQHQATGRDGSQALSTRNSRAIQRNRSIDELPIAEHRWQLSYC